MIRTFARLAVLLAIVTFSACQKQESGGTATRDNDTAATALVLYDCPMHPEVTSSTPGKCPKCGMALVEVVSAGGHEHAEGDHSHDHGEGARPHADHNPKHGGMLGMQGDYHLELVAHHGGDLEVYLYDAYTKPMSVKGIGTIRLEMPAGTPEAIVPIEPRTDGAAFHGHSPTADEALSATIDVTLPDTTLSMTFPLQATLTGEIVDIDCLIRLGEKGRGSIHSECASACIRNGMPVGLAVGKTVYVLTLGGEGSDRAANERLAELAGKQVQVTGRVREANGLKMIELADVEPVAVGG